MLQWARGMEPPCPWDADMCNAAARGGQLGVLLWARTQVPPCPWQFEIVCGLAEDAGHTDMFLNLQNRAEQAWCMLSTDNILQ